MLVVDAPLECYKAARDLTEYLYEKRRVEHEGLLVTIDRTVGDFALNTFITLYDSVLTQKILNLPSLETISYKKDTKTLE
jgi:hypothetical protein